MPHILGSVCHIFCRNPVILREFYAIRAPIVWHMMGAFICCKCGGLGVVSIFLKWCRDNLRQLHSLSKPRCLENLSMAHADHHGAGICHKAEPPERVVNGGFELVSLESAGEEVQP